MIATLGIWILLQLLLSAETAVNGVRTVEPEDPSYVPIDVPSGEKFSYKLNRPARLYSNAGISGNALSNRQDDVGGQSWHSGEDTGYTYTTDLTAAGDGYSGSVGWPDQSDHKQIGHSYHSNSKIPVKTHKYHSVVGKGWNSPGYGHHHSWQAAGGHDNDYQGWGQVNTGWGWGLQDVGHNLWHSFSGWMGLKGVSGTTLTSILHYLLIGIPVVAVILVLLFFLPIPILISPTLCSRAATARILSETSRLANVIFTSEECIERISCQIASASKRIDKLSLIDRIIDHIPATTSTWFDRAIRAIKVATKNSPSRGENCSKFTCDPLGRLNSKLLQAPIRE